MLPAITRATAAIATKIGPRLSSLSRAAKKRLSSTISAFKGGDFSTANVTRVIKENPVAAAIIGVEVLGWADDAVKALFDSDSALEGQYRVLVGDGKLNGTMDSDEAQAMARRDDDLEIVAIGANAVGGVERLQKIARALAHPTLIDYLHDEKNKRGIRRTSLPPY